MDPSLIIVADRLPQIAQGTSTNPHRSSTSIIYAPPKCAKKKKKSATEPLQVTIRFAIQIYSKEINSQNLKGMVILRLDFAIQIQSQEK